MTTHERQAIVSTKIYEGYRLPRSVDVFGFANVARDLASTNTAKLVAESIVERASVLVDLRRLGLDNSPQIKPGLDPLCIATAAYNEDQRNAAATAPGRDLYSFGMDFTPDASGEFYAVVAHHHAHHSVIDELVAKHGLERYGYWDNSDRPDGISPSQWTSRREFWESSLVDGTCGGRGLSIAPRSNGRVWRDEVLESIRTFGLSVADKPARARQIEVAVLLYVHRRALGSAPGWPVVWALVRQDAAAVRQRVESLLGELTIEDLLSPVESLGTVDEELEWLSKEHLKATLGIQAGATAP